MKHLGHLIDQLTVWAVRWRMRRNNMRSNRPDTFMDALGVAMAGEIARRQALANRWKAELQEADASTAENLLRAVAREHYENLQAGSAGQKGATRQ